MNDLVIKVEEGHDDVTLTSLQLGSKHLVVPKKWPTYKEDGTFLERDAYLSASEMNKCLRMAWFAKFGRTGIKAFETNGYAERGDAVEAWIVNRIAVLREQGYELRYTGEDQRSFYEDISHLSGTPDGLMTVPNDGVDGIEDRHILLEFKSIDPRVNRRNLPKKAHIMQTQVNMYLVSLCLGIEVKEARLLYIDASDFGRQEEYIVHYHPDYIDVAKQRAIQLFGAPSADDTEPEGLKTGDCDTCKFGALCSAMVDTTKAAMKAGASTGFFADALDNTQGLTNAEMDKLTTFLELYDASDAVEFKLKEAKNEARAIVLDHGGVVHVGEAKISVGVQAGKTSFDMKAAEAAGLKLDPFKKVGAPFTVMTVK